MNRESAHEMLSRRDVATPDEVAPTPPQPAPEPVGPEAPGRARSRSRAAKPARGGGLSDLLWGTKRRQGVAETMAKQAARTMGSQIGRSILRGVLGGILGGSRRR